MTPEEFVVRRMTVDLPGGRLLRVVRWEEDLSLSVVWPETPATEPAGLRLPASDLPSLREALDSLEGD